MTSPHPLFVSIFAAYGVAPAELDEEERCPGCGVAKELHKHCEAPCPFDGCPFREDDQ